MLSPVETLGLSSSTLESRLRQALRQVPDAELIRVARKLEGDALRNDVVYERDGRLEPVRIMLRPLAVMPEQLAYVHHVCALVTDALKRLPVLYLEDADVRRALPIDPREAAWLRQAWGPSHAQQNPLYGRLDAVCNFTTAAWRESLWFLEPNLSGVGGIHFAPLCESLVMRDVVPTLRQHDPDLQLELPRDQRDLFLQLLLDHAQAAGRSGRNLCFIEPKYDRGGPDEQPALTAHLRQAHGLTVVHADPRELRLLHDEVYYEDVCIDVAYRDYETRDLIALGEREGLDLAAMRALFRQNRVVSSIGGDFDHKSCFELMTDDALAVRHFTAEERRLFRRHVPWTRLLAQRRCSLPTGEGDLPEHVRAHREELVLKPNRSYGGAGIQLGSLCTQAQWERHLDAALALADDPHESFVVQQAASLPVHEFPVASGGRVHEEPFFVVMGFAPTDGGLGILCRASQRKVVNVAQRGGLAAVLVGHPPAELLAPRRSFARSDAARARLRSQIADLRGLDAAIGLLGWDEETYLPAQARAGRGEQLATLESLRHRLLCSDVLSDLVHEVAAQAEPGSVLADELARLSRLRALSLALPDELVRAFAAARSHCLASWEHARARNDFATFASAFAPLLSLIRERAQALSPTGEPYDGLLDEHEPGLRRARIEPVLRQLGARLPPLVAELSERTADTPRRLSEGHFADAEQDALCRSVLVDIGFDFARGRLDRSSHPFTLAAGIDDVRVTVRVREDDPLPALFAALHEGGHALYDQGFAPELHGTLLADGAGMGLHESQSRLWENHVGRSRAYWEHLLPRLRQRFGARLSGVSAAQAHRVVNVVRPGVNRVDADEVSYDLHILLRFELELALLHGELDVAGLPAAWNARHVALLGVGPQTDAEGCLQDVHWSLGAFGYFPSYSLGNLYAAQLFEAFERDNPSFAQDAARGQLAVLRAFLRAHVHAHGCRLPGETVIERATGRGLDLEPYLALLSRKHSELG